LGAYGFFKGFINRVIFIISLIVATSLTSHFGDEIVKFFVSKLKNYEKIINFVGFVFIFAFFQKVSALVLGLIGKIISFVKIIPFLTTIDKFLGILVGFLEGIFGIFIIFHILKITNLFAILKIDYLKTYTYSLISFLQNHAGLIFGFFK
jgi:uncharacterized membrane protein required for colicin V production